MLKGSDIECVVVSDYSDDKIYSCPGFRLPTEAEWEHAYRAGTATATYVGSVDVGLCGDTQKVDPGLAQIAWYAANSNGAPHSHAEGLKQPNAWGLYDMAGNVAEWCHDYLQKDLGSASVVDPVGQVIGAATRVLRGGSWASAAGGLRAAARETRIDTDTSDRVGFRCARTLAP
jgi:formylglycine-generating enzyme required for sulfatase activity